MRTLRMMWNTENGHLICHWVDIRDRQERGSLSPVSAPESPHVRPRRNTVPGTAKIFLRLQNPAA